MNFIGHKVRCFVCFLKVMLDLQIENLDINTPASQTMLLIFHGVFQTFLTSLVTEILSLSTIRLSMPQEDTL